MVMYGNPNQLAFGMLEGLQPQTQGGMYAQPDGNDGMFQGPQGGGPRSLVPGASEQGLHPSMPPTQGGMTPVGYQTQSADAPPLPPQTWNAPQQPQQMQQMQAMGSGQPPAGPQGFGEQFAQYLNNPAVAAGLGFGTSMIGAGSVGEGLAKGIGGGLAGLQGAQQGKKDQAEDQRRRALLDQIIQRMGGVANIFGDQQAQQQQQQLVGQQQPQAPMGGMY